MEDDSYLKIGNRSGILAMIILLSCVPAVIFLPVVIGGALGIVAGFAIICGVALPAFGVVIAWAWTS